MSINDQSVKLEKENHYSYMRGKEDMENRRAQQCVIVLFGYREHWSDPMANTNLNKALENSPTTTTAQ